MPELTRKIGRNIDVYGGWMPSLLNALRSTTDVEIAVACIDPETNQLVKHEIEGVTYFLLPLKQPKEPQLTPAFVEACTEAITAFHPDIIHVHGTEYVYGLFTAQAGCRVPTVISIQGLLHVYSRYVDGGITLRDSFDGGIPGLLSWLRFQLQQFQWIKRGRVEQQILKGNENIIGRTDWDKAHVFEVNPEARYFYGGELLRLPFHEAQWDLAQSQRHSLFCTAAHSPLKGFHWLLYAVNLLKKEFPDINVRVAGAPWNDSKGFGYYGRYLKRLIDKYGLSSHVTPLSSLSAEEVAKELKRAHAFVIPSLIENSPNSLAEAMMVGTPCVASLIGGIPSMVENEKSALCFPGGDVAYLAHCIRRIFTNDELAQQLSSNARAVALERHAPEKIIPQLMETYRNVASTPM